MLMLVLGLWMAAVTFAGPGWAADEVKGSAKDLLIGKWQLAQPNMKQTVEFAKDGTMKMTTGHMEVNGKLVPLMKDGKPIDLTLEGKYKFTADNAIETTLSNPFPEAADKTPLTGRWQQVNVTKDVLTFVEGEGRQRKYERIK